MKWMALLFLAMAAVAQTGDQGENRATIRADNPQEHGWFLGDELIQNIHVTLPESVEIDPASLPRPRAVDYWLDLRRVEIQPKRDGVLLTLHWQNFYAAIAPDWREVPPSTIRLTDGSTMELPGFGFVTSPLRPITAPSSPEQMRSEPAFHLIDLLPNRVGLAASLTAFVLLLGLMAWHFAWWPFHARPARPFAMAARQIAGTPDPIGQRRILHRAFDQAFGRVLIGPDLPHFLAKRPEFTAESERLTLFFNGSDADFFSPAPTTTRAPDTDIPELTRALVRIERGQR